MRMAKDPEKVKTFLVDLAEKLRPLQDKEVKVFLDYKKEEVGLYIGWLHFGLFSCLTYMYFSFEIKIFVQKICS